LNQYKKIILAQTLKAATEEANRRAEGSCKEGGRRSEEGGCRSEGGGGNHGGQSKG
jgi:hypothetical protein